MGVDAYLRELEVQKMTRKIEEKPKLKMIFLSFRFFLYHSNALHNAEFINNYHLYFNYLQITSHPYILPTK